MSATSQRADPERPEQRPDADAQLGQRVGPQQVRPHAPHPRVEPMLASRGNERIVGRQRRPSRRQRGRRGEPADDRGPGVGVLPDRRLVEQDDAGPVGEGSDEGEPPLLPAGQPERVGRAPGAPGRRRRARPRTSTVTPSRLRRLADLVADRLGEEPVLRVLRHPADGASEPARTPAAQVRGDACPPAGLSRPPNAASAVDLPAPHGPVKAVTAAGLDGAVEAAQRRGAMGAAERPRDQRDRDVRRRRCSAARRRRHERVRDVQRFGRGRARHPHARRRWARRGTRRRTPSRHDAAAAADRRSPGRRARATARSGARRRASSAAGGDRQDRVAERPRAERASSIDVGSSSSRTSGRTASTPASTSRCSSPPDSADMNGSRPYGRSTAASAASTSRPDLRRGSARAFSRPKATSRPMCSATTASAGFCSTRPSRPPTCGRDRTGRRRSWCRTPGKRVQQRRLAGAGRADDQHPLAGFDGQVEVARASAGRAGRVGATRSLGSDGGCGRRWQSDLVGVFAARPGRRRARRPTARPGPAASRRGRRRRRRRAAKKPR